MNPAVFQGPDNPMPRLDALGAELRAQGRPVYDFGIGDPLEPMAPFLIQALKDAVPAVGRYPRVTGSPELRRAIAGYLRRRFDASLDPDREILPAAGAKEAIFHLPLCLVDPRSERRAIVFPEPGYPIYERGCAFAGGEPHPVPLREEAGFLLEPSELPEALLRRTAIFWLCYPNNPTGALAPRAYLERVAEASRRHGFTVAADECYADLHGAEPPLSYLQVARERALVIHSLSKRSGMTGMRSGFMAGDPEIIAALKRFRPALGTASQDFVQAAATAAWSDDAHAAERRRIFEAKRQLFVPFLREMGLRVAGGPAGLYLWIELPGRQPSEPWVLELARRSGIVLMPGVYLGAAGEGHVRLALVPTLDDCREAIRLWKASA
ncbi:MAG: succinyldiaminopimelate transaminase [Myxococcales bacterium]